MSITYAVINEPSVPVYAGTEGFVVNEEGLRVSNVSDEGLYGSLCRILEEQNGWVHLLSAYGYEGYVESSTVLRISEAGLKAWQADPVITTGICTDVLSAPTVHGKCILTLPRGSVVQYMGPAEEGYSLVGLADGSTGYIAANRLAVKRFGEELLNEDPHVLMSRQANAVSKREIEIGGTDRFDFRAYLDKWYEGTPEEQEQAFRRELTETAKGYLGVQYRWGGRSSFGIDCSGLTHMSYMLCGILIYRDASIVEGYPLKRLDLNWKEGHFDLSDLDKDALKPGDTLYFPGHVALYLGDGMYIHSTGKAGDMGVVCNSLRPDHPLFREDLLEKLYAAAGLRL